MEKFKTHFHLHFYLYVIGGFSFPLPVWSHTGDRLRSEILYTRRDAIDAYERHTGFQGIGQFLIEEGLIIVKEEEPSCAE